MSNAWGADTPISMPQPLSNDDAAGPTAPMGGFVFTASGLMHDLTQSDWEDMSRPTYRPSSPATTVWGDHDVEGG